MKQQAETIEGKTIRRVVESAQGDALLFIFTDDTFAAYNAGGDDEGAWISEGFDLLHFGDEQLIEAGIATVAELKAKRTRKRRGEQKRTKQFHASFDVRKWMRDQYDIDDSKPSRNGRIIGLSLTERE